MAEKNEVKNVSITLIIWIIIAILLVVGGIYAWFSFNTITNVSPDSAGVISDGGVGLLISNMRDGIYGETCDLILQSTGGDLAPVSTANLEQYYQASAQNGSGISILYIDATNQIDDCSIHGTVYLKADGGSADIYLYKPQCTFGGDIQALATMRLGLKITDSNGSRVIIFKLDDMADTSSAQTQLTVPTEGTVVASLDNSAANYVSDPAQNINDYTASGDENLSPGTNKLGTVSSGSITSVEYWLYLEGCDPHCINAVQLKDISFALSFGGTPAK